jgi:hypothetical protein
MEQIRLGKKVRVSDPCYGTKVWCAGTIDNVKEGLYNVEVEMSDEGMWGNRVKSLTVVHADYKGFLVFNKSARFEVGVDSGQAGIYDEDYYNKYHTADDCDDDWYDDICSLTNPAGTKDGKCVVSSSGFGDGCYICELVVEGSEVVAIRITFIEDEEEDEEDYEDEWEEESDEDEEDEEDDI